MSGKFQRKHQNSEAAQAKYFIPNGSSLEVCEKLLVPTQNVAWDTQEREDLCKWGSILSQDVKLSTDLLNPSFISAQTNLL